MDLFAFLTCRRPDPAAACSSAIVAGVFWLLSLISNRNSQAEERLERIGRPKSLAEIEMTQAERSRQRFAGLQGRVQQPRRGRWSRSRELEKNALQDQAGQRRLPQRVGRRPSTRASASSAWSLFLLPAAVRLPAQGRLHRSKSLQWIVIFGGHRLLPAADRPVVPADDAAEGDLPDPAGRPGPAGGVRRVAAWAWTRPCGR